MLIFRKVSELSRKVTKGQKKYRDLETEEKISAFIDVEYYLNTNPDVRAAGLDPTTHYDCFGWKEGRDPSPSFSTQKYLTENPELLKTTKNPLRHFVESIEEKSEKSDKTANILEVIFEDFDTDYYLKKYSECIPDGYDPAMYFCETGWRKGHDPNRWFSTSHYLTTNADVKDSGVNPFWHYLVAGRDEGRTPQGHHCWQTDTAISLRPLEKTKCDWLRSDAVPKVLKARELHQILLRELADESVLISISHDDYRTVPGGVQLCIGVEESQAKSQGMRHLHMYPWQMLPTLADKSSDPILCLTLDGTPLGCARTSVLDDAISSSKYYDISMTCHHLAGHSIEGIVAIAQSAGLSECDFWLHDYFGICTSYTLMRNNIQDCGAPEAASNSCTLCVFGDERKNQVERFALLFESLDVHLISPSSVALELWAQKSNLRTKSVRVYPHVVLHKETIERGPDLAFPKPIRIGFIGALSPHKGWPVFQQLKKQFGDDPRYEFWLFSATKMDVPDVKHVHVHAHSETPFATLLALREAQIDLVLHWATWRETFSFSTFEALAAGAFVITNEGSGNVAKTVKENDAGLVLSSSKALFEMAQSNALVNLATSSRKLRSRYEYIMEFSDMAVSKPLDKIAAA